MSGPYEIPQPWATAPQMGTKCTPDMSFFQRVFNSLAWAVQYDVRYVCTCGRASYAFPSELHVPLPWVIHARLTVATTTSRPLLSP